MPCNVTNAWETCITHGSYTPLLSERESVMIWTYYVGRIVGRGSSWNKLSPTICHQSTMSSGRCFGFWLKRHRLPGYKHFEFETVHYIGGISNVLISNHHIQTFRRALYPLPSQADTLSFLWLTMGHLASMVDVLILLFSGFNRRAKGSQPMSLVPAHKVYVIWFGLGTKHWWFGDLLSSCKKANG